MNFKITDCVGGRHYSQSMKIRGDFTQNENGMPVKLLVEMCSICERKKSLIVSDRTIQAVGLGNFFSSLGKAAKLLERKI